MYVCLPPPHPPGEIEKPKAPDVTRRLKSCNLYGEDYQRLLKRLCPEISENPKESLPPEWHSDDPLNERYSHFRPVSALPDGWRQAYLKSIKEHSLNLARLAGLAEDEEAPAPKRRRTIDEH